MKHDGAEYLWRYQECEEKQATYWFLVLYNLPLVHFFHHIFIHQSLPKPQLNSHRFTPFSTLLPVQIGSPCVRWRGNEDLLSWGSYESQSSDHVLWPPQPQTRLTGTDRLQILCWASCKKSNIWDTLPETASLPLKIGPNCPFYGKLHPIPNIQKLRCFYWDVFPPW